jgi:hypothetical protein
MINNNKNNGPIPNELKITINTSIPGFQNIRYKPSMTLPKDKVDETIQFNPLIKLKPSIIKSLPKEIQIKEFFNKGYFQSLINTHGLTNAKTLLQATNEGFVDNNIQVTLDTIFPTNTILYINKQPYVIADVQWTKGDWKIDKKIQQLPDIDSSRINDPYIYNAIVKDEIISGEKELETLPKNLIYGANYTGPINVGKGVGPPIPPGPPTPRPAAPRPPVPRPPAPRPPVPNPYNKPPKPIPYPPLPPRPYPPLPPPPRGPKPPLPPPPQGPKPPLPPGPKPPVPRPHNKPPKPTPYPPLPPPEEPLAIEDVKLIPLKAPTLIFSRKPSLELKTYFQQPNYYFMINTIFKNMNEREKKLVVQIFKETTSVDVKYNVGNISKTAYDATITPGLKVNSNTGGGDCFFIAVADGINYYNAACNTMQERIIYNNYGNNISFTQMSLREIVAYQLTHLDKSEYDRLYDYINVNINLLNNEFKRQYDDFINNVSPQMPENVFMDYINNIYKSSDNFLVSKPSSMTPKTIQQPFTMVDKSNYANYIKSSDYWGDFFAIDALCTVLKLNIITIEKIEDTLRIPYISNVNNWKHYMFLFNEVKHYELISFDYTFTRVITDPKISEKKIIVKKTVFNKGSNIFPPFYIIFLVFASFYINILDKNVRIIFQLFPDNILEILYRIFDTILHDQSTMENKKFIKLVKQYFSPSILRNIKSSFKAIEPANPFDDDTSNPFGDDSPREIGGGAPIYSNKPQYSMNYPFKPSYNSYNPRGQPSFYSRPMLYSRQPPYASNFVKSNTNVDEANKTNISYYITINMELHPGTSLTSEDLSNIKCNQRWNAIRKSYANMRGLKYTMLPDYSMLAKNKTVKNTPSTNSTNNTNTRKVITKPSSNSITQKSRFIPFNNRTRRA